MIRRLFAASLTLVLAAGLLLAASMPAFADHDELAPPFGTAIQPGDPVPNSGPAGAWEHIATVPTGNPHTDLDFFTQGGEDYVSVGTLGTGPNAAGQTILQLTQNGKVVPPKPTLPGSGSIRYVSGHPSAECPSNPLDTLGLQHDVEATPKGDAILNVENPRAVRSDTQLIVDATDAPGRCHDGGPQGPAGPVPQGGLELVDVADVNDPVEIGLTSHIGEAHTVNIDPKRPHIAYAVTSDAVGIDPITRQRRNEIEGSSDQWDLDGFEVVDMSSCMDFPEGTSSAEKRQSCRPQVYRYRYPSTAISLGTVAQNTVYGCHELELYPNDRLTCGSGAAAIVFDVGGAFNDRGTPKDFTDDRPRGKPLPCRVRDSSSAAPYQTGAKDTDCVQGRNGQDLSVPAWLEIGAPSLQGVRHVGSAHHMGRGGPRPSTEDVDFDHELELTASGDYVLATDERGGGVTPPGATCATGVDNPQGNGGIHAYATDRLDTSPPGSAAEADDAYARTESGDKAIYRVTPRTGVEATTCTAHVFQQIPGQNRIFMGWYSQGTQVVDFVERRDGTVEFRDAGHFIPTDANQWVSHIFKVERNNDGTFTYYGVAGDFKIDSGRNSIEVYKVTLPAPQLCESRRGRPCTPGPAPATEQQSAASDVGMALAGLLLLPTAAVVGRRRRRRELRGAS
ncbi:MAG: hypothetical protein ACRDU8_00775 [Egibacteraceae bacterium]